MEKVVETSRMTLPDGEEFDLEYFLVTEEAPKERARAYGIGVQKLLKKAKGDGKAGQPDKPKEAGKADWPEREVVEKLTESEEKARDWIGKLARNQVTPVSLIEVLDAFVTKEGI